MTGEVWTGLGRRLCAGFVFVGASVLALGCGGSSIERKAGADDGGSNGGPVKTYTENRFVSPLNQSAVGKLDLLLMVDNSIGMADKQAVFAEAVPELVQRFTSPVCVDATTGLPDRVRTPTDPAAACPSTLVRQFRPLRDIHVGIITSSLGGHGSQTLCVGNDAGTLEEQETNDHGWLIGKRPRFTTPPDGIEPEQEGFLNWSPDTIPDESVPQFASTLRAMTLGAGEFGCGLESQLEATYRFLVDPRPYDTIAVQNCPGSSEPCAVPQGTDTNLLAQRAAFLRPDSAVVIVMLTDENDCSIRESGQYFYAARDNIILPHGSSVCASNPNDKCCYFCNSQPPAGCDDPTCMQPTPRTQDQPNLRCFNQLQRFGFDFLYPTQRYVNAFTRAQICTARADLAPDPGSCNDLDGDKMPDLFDNPLFRGVNGTTAIPRDASLVFLAGIVGVPWQDLRTATRPDGTSSYPPNELHYRTAAQLQQDNIWSVILGDAHPDLNSPPIPPSDALMIESKDPRGGSDGENPPGSLAAPSASRLANPVNGHEWTNSDQDDLQYACIFNLPKSRDCAEAIMKVPAPGCDCKPGHEGNNNPLCQQAAGNYTTFQTSAKAYPGLRPLQVLKDFGANSTVASICARNTTDKSAQDYGYRPAVDAIVDSVGHAFTGKCFPRTLILGADGKIPCSVVESAPGDLPCDAARGRSKVDADERKSVLASMKRMGFCDTGNVPPCSAFSLCQIDEASETCHLNQVPTEAGWCYVDPAVNPGDDISLVAGCPATQRRILRFVDPEGRTPAPGAMAFLVCH